MSLESLLDSYEEWLCSARSRGAVSPCSDPRLTERLRRSVLEEPELHNALRNDAFSLIAGGLQDKPDLLPALQRLAEAFQALEGAALQLCSTPWRKEYHTIRTYSGHYVHVLEAALSPEGILLALRRLGYEPQAGGACLTLHAQLSPHVLQMAALGFLAAQLECRILADIASCSGAALVNGADLLQERRSWRGEAACMERLRRLIEEGAAARIPVELYEGGGKGGDGALYRPPIRGETGDGCCREKNESLVLLRSPRDVPQLGGDRSHAPQPGDRSHAPQPGDRSHAPQPGDRSHAPQPGEWVHKVQPGTDRSHTVQLGGDRRHAVPPGVERSHVSHLGDQNHAAQPLRDCAMHDCVFLETSLEKRCTDCRLLHGPACPQLRRCRDAGHQVARLTPSQKLEAVSVEEQDRKHRLHLCLQPGQLPHYRCAQCRELHYINCREIAECRRRGHSAKMIMLEKDQRLWLQRSLMDLTLLCGADRAADPSAAQEAGGGATSQD